MRFLPVFFLFFLFCASTQMMIVPMSDPSAMDRSLSALKKLEFKIVRIDTLYNSYRVYFKE